MMKLSKDQLKTKIDYVKSYAGMINAATASEVDPNANITSQNVATLMSDLWKDASVQLKRAIITNRIEIMYGKEVANQYNEQIANHEIYVHDESHPLFPYCSSVTMYPFLLEGLKGLGGDAKAPKHLDSFCGGFINLVFCLCSQFAGAIATVEFLVYFDYFARKDYGPDYLKTHAKEISDKFQQVVYSLNMPAGARSYQCPFWNISVMDRGFFNSLFGDFAFPDEDLTKSEFDSVNALQKFFMEWFNKEREVSMLTFPVLTAASLTSKGQKEIMDDPEFSRFLCKQMSMGNSFFNYMSEEAASLSSCCRLKNDIEKNEFSFSLGAGGIMTGSINVITVNYNRIIQNFVRENGSFEREAFDSYMLKKLELLYKYQRATRSYFEDLEKAGLLPAYSSHFISMKKQYSTIGINGMLEAAEFVGLKPGNNDEYKDFLKANLKLIYDRNKEARKEYGMLINTEFVPAENLGVKNYKWDKEDGYVVNPKRNCYNSYFYAVEDESCSIVDKFVLHGREINQYLDGGSALHLNLAEYPTEEGYMKLFELAAKTGCNYWTTNVAVTCCEDCGYIDKHTLHHCTKCGSKNVTWATRIIGYLRKITNFSEERQIEERMRYYHKL